MILGIVTPDFKVAVHVQIISATGQPYETEVFVDTGFNGELSLARDFITRSGFPLLEESIVQLADGREITVQIFDGRVEWNGITRKVDIIASEGDPLLGMMLLNGSELKIEVRSGGAVIIEPLDHAF